MRHVWTNVELSHARATAELIRAVMAEARCLTLLLDGDNVEAHLECIVLEQTIRELEQLPLCEADAARLRSLKLRFRDLAASAYAA